MGNDAERYLRAAGTIPQGGLSAIAGEAISDAEVARLFHKHVAFRENERFLGMQGGSVDGYQLRGAAAFEKFSNELARRNAKGRSSQTFDTVLHLALLSDLNTQIDFLNGRIAQSEAGFAARYGADWREHMAQSILDPDEFPQQREGESLQEYHQRLEDVLIAKMLDENGNIKPEYASHPERRAWAQWAKDRFEKRQAEATVQKINAIAADPDLSAEEKGALFAAELEELDTQGLEVARNEGQLTTPQAQAAADAEYDQGYDRMTVTVDNSSF